MRQIYKLPDGIRDGEIEAEEVWGGCAGGRPEYRLAGGFTLLAPAGQPLERVKPPLPEEPPVGTVVLVEAPAAIPIVFFRYPDGWAEPAQSTYYDWAKVCSYGTPIRYVPDPFAEPVALPWKRQIGEFPTMAHVEPIDKGVGLALDSGGRRISPDLSLDEARELGCALTTAADAAEKERS